MGLKQLPQKLRKNGFDYILIKRGKRTLIYGQYIKSRIISYEDFRIRIKPRQEFNGKIFLEREKFPSNEDFGYGAFSIREYDRAIKKFEEMENNNNN